jgi:orotate phosphoribosyltransferase
VRAGRAIMEPIPFPRTQQGDGFETVLTKRKLFEAIKAKSFAKRKIKLASGRESNFYFDMKPTMFDPEGSNLLADIVLHRLDGLSIDYIGGLAVGAVPLISTMVMLSYQRKKPLPGFFVRQEVKDHGTRRKIEGTETESLAGSRVVILDDVTTSGGSAMIAVDAAKAAGASIVLVLSIVDREEGAASTFAKAGVPFESLFKAHEFLQD